MAKVEFFGSCSLSRIYTFYIEKTINYKLHRWIVFVLTLVLYVRRIVHVHGFYLITYALALYLLNLWLGFLSPIVQCSVSTL